MTTSNIAAAKNAVTAIENMADLLRALGLESRWGFVAMGEALEEFRSSLAEAQWGNTLRFQASYEAKVNAWAIEDQEDGFEAVMGELEDELNIVLAEDAIDGIRTRNANRIERHERFLKEAGSWLRYRHSSNSRIRKERKKNFRREHQARLEMAL